MPLIETKGAASAQGFGLTLGSSGPVTYIEDVFSTWLYNGNDSAQTITNGIDLSGKGGMVWRKRRTTSGADMVMDTLRGTNALQAYSASGQFGSSDSFTALSNGFSFNTANFINVSGNTYASWTFRKQPKFFDVVTYTGNGSNRTISHNLGSVPGCIIVKRTDAAADWQVYHRSLSSTEYMVLNSTASKATSGTIWNSTIPTATDFSLGTDSTVNASGGSYVAYLFAHNAGGFGLTGTDNVISCGSFTTDGSGNSTVNLGYEPQWIMFKRTDSTGNWFTMDIMRRWYRSSEELFLSPNTSTQESVFNTNAQTFYPIANGFQSNAGITPNSTYIYITMRRGPMKVPTSGTSVFSPVAYSGTGTTTTQTLTTNFPVDAFIQTSRQDGTTDRRIGNRLVGEEKYVLTNLSAAEQTIGGGNGVNNTVGFSSNTGIGVRGDWNNPSSPGYSPFILEAFRRAPSFFDLVCYTGTGAASQSYNHNLGVAPELMLVKVRSSSGSWAVYSSALGASTVLTLNASDAAFTSGSVFSAYWGSAAPTSSVFSVGSIGNTGGNSSTYVAYLFATCAGVSKVGSYTGTAALQTINCGFTGGARFVLIKRTDSTGDWVFYDSARGISSGNDPYLTLNLTAAEVTSTNYVDTTSVGFQVTAAAPAGLNASGGTYLFLAIA